MLTRCETEPGRLPVGGSNQAFGHQQEGREDQGVDNRDRDYANGKAAVVIVKVGPENIAKSRDDEKKAAGHHERRPLQSPRAGPNDQVQISAGGNTAHEADGYRGDQSSWGAARIIETLG